MNDCRPILILVRANVDYQKGSAFMAQVSLGAFMAQVSQGFNNLPTITFHLSGADLLLQPQAAFYVDTSDEPSKREYFCLAMSSESDETVIGAYQLTHHRFHI
ncbi:unnamed protein product [Prunus armeniaca]|uniref:Xylanase inhibitor C-terminal domain-containing protein n=1 Tax=Prunus armeniaca TaxID=36596 RepID=A0A6J5UJT5_PRUAR|nr:unnamed protein product [Prunus armeniaca]